MLHITSSDGVKVEVTQDIKVMSKLIENALNEDDNEVVVLPVPNVDAANLKMIVEYCEHHKFNKVKSDILRPLKGKDLEHSIPDTWEREFIQKLDKN